ncbi:hypothetical protein VNO77_03190 [Canavalia gladiata]|uniref:Uncharacterized protein n=1 Tax=Canavalia gladiata TaxID=3824 RepID=A0AAN9R6P1_CANGL
MLLYEDLRSTASQARNLGHHSVIGSCSPFCLSDVTSSTHTPRVGFGQGHLAEACSLVQLPCQARRSGCLLVAASQVHTSASPLPLFGHRPSTPEMDYSSYDHNLEALWMSHSHPEVGQPLVRDARLRHAAFSSLEIVLNLGHACQDTPILTCAYWRACHRNWKPPTYSTGTTPHYNSLGAHVPNA